VTGTAPAYSLRIMEFISKYSKNILRLSVALSCLGSVAFANNVTLTSGVDTNNNIKTNSAGTTVDTNWLFTQYDDSYNLTRAQVFGASVANPNGAIGYNISSAAASAASTNPTNIAASVITAANRPAGWYNPGTAAQWLSLSPKQANGGVPIDPPGNYVYQLNLSPYVNIHDGEVTITMTGVNADNHYAFAIGGSVAAEEYLVKPLATTETYSSAGSTVTFSFSPADGTKLDLIVANDNDQVKSDGSYEYSKNPTGFMVRDLTVTQASGTPSPMNAMTSDSKIDSGVVAGTGTVYSRSLIAAPEPAAWMVMGGFVLIALGATRFRKPLQS